MPSFAFLPPEQIQALAYYVRSLNADAFDMKPAGDVAAGADLFFGAGHCSECHTAHGHGGINGPDLSNIAHLSTLAELTQSILQPDARISNGYGMVTVNLRDGTGLRGFARAQTAHSIDLQTKDGRLLLLTDEQYKSVVADKTSLMPAFQGTATQQRDLLAYLSSLAGVASGPNSALPATIDPAAIDAVLHPKAGDWPTYAGNVSGNRYSTLDAINVKTVSRLRPAWIHPIAYTGLETTPLVIDGVMYVTAPNQVYALDGRTGTEIWSWTRPRSAAENISGDAAKGANRGVALLGDRVYFITDNAHLVCLQRVSGALLWDVAINDQPGHYGATSAPLVIGDLVIVGVSGATRRSADPSSQQGYDRRAGVALLDRAEGRRARLGDVGGCPESDGGGAPGPRRATTPRPACCTSRSAIPYPDTDGDQRGGDNLYTDSDLAIDPKTGKLLWYFQYTPHDLHDWDANQPLALVDAPFQGQQRKLLLHANRNGFLYVLDRTNGKFLQGSAMVKKLTWASGVGKDGRPILLPANETNEVGVKACPAVRGATNWYSTAFNPATQLYYVMTVEDCSTYRKAHDGGYGFLRDPADPSKKVLRAFMVDSGKIAWEVPMDGNPERNYSGVLSTAGGLVCGERAAALPRSTRRTARVCGISTRTRAGRGSPMTYTVDGHQYIAIASESNILSFALADR